MPAHHMSEYLLIKKNAGTQVEMHPQQQPERGAA
jgi:hypothetical protein